MTIPLLITACAPMSGADSGKAQEQRQAVVEMVRSGDLTDDDGDGFVTLPDKMVAAGRDRVARVWTDPELTVFFLTGVGFSTDPYCGYEYTEDSDPIADPLGSGSNYELEPIGAGWFSICAR